MPAVAWALVLGGMTAVPTPAAAVAAAASALPVAPPPVAADRVLIVAPHIDDEAIGAAGYAAAALAAGAEVAVCYLTAGDYNRTSNRILESGVKPRTAAFLALGGRRIQEAQAAMALLGVAADHLYLLGYPDGGLKRMLDAPGQLVRAPGTGRTAVPYRAALSPGAPYRLPSLLADLGTVLARTRPTVVILPAPFDSHTDHSAGCRITLAAVAASGQRPRLLGYLVHAARFPFPFLLAPHHPLLPPRRLAREPWSIFPLSPAAVAAKRRVLGAYQSQRADLYLRVLFDAFVRTNELFVRLDLPAGEPASRPASRPQPR